MAVLCSNVGIIPTTSPLTRRTGRRALTTITRCSTIKPTKFSAELRVANKKPDR